MFGSLAPRSTALNSCDDALSKFHRIRVWHCSTSKSGINANRLAHKQPLGNPSILLGTFRFYSAETCSKTADPLDDYIDAVGKALGLPIDEAWRPAVKANLEFSLRIARLVDEFALPDETEPASVFAA